MFTIFGRPRRFLYIFPADGSVARSGGWSEIEALSQLIPVYTDFREFPVPTISSLELVSGLCVNTGISINFNICIGNDSDD